MSKIKKCLCEIVKEKMKLIFKKITLCIKSLFWKKMVGAIEAGALYSTVSCEGKYQLVIFDDEFDSCFPIGNEKDTHLEIVKLSQRISWDYPHGDFFNAI